MNIKNFSVIVLLICFSLVASWLLYIVEFKYRLAVAGLLVVGILVIAKLLSFSWQDIGLDSSMFLKSVKIALPFIGLIVLVMGAAFLINREWFLDSRYNQSLSSVLFTIFVVVPFSTVLLEELFFRGLLFGYSNLFFSTFGAVLVSSLSFGFWHLFSSQNVELPTKTIPAIAVSLGVIILTSIAGLFFSWLRIKGGSIFAPALVHWTINSFGVLLSYLAWR